MMAGGIYEHRQLHLFYSGREHMHNNVLHLVIGKSLCYFSLYILCTAYILHFIPWLFKYPQIGSQVEIYSFAVPFLLSSIFFGMTLSIFVRERESSFLLFVFTSVIFLFISAGVLEVVGCSHSVYLGNRRLCTYEYGRGWYL